MVPYLGDYAEDATVYIPFNTFTSDDPSVSATITNLADADIKVHKDGGTTEIATDGATVTIDFDTRTGCHLITVDTSAHADYSTGSDYMVLIEGTTIDGGNNINAWVGHFSIENRTTFPKADMPTNFASLNIESDGDVHADVKEWNGTAVTASSGLPQLLQSTTIATLASQTSFTLTAGSADNDAYNNAIAVITDSSTSTQKAVGTVSDYVGSTRTVTLSADPGIFTMAVGDTIEIIAALGSAGSAPSAADIADAVWEEAQADHTTVTSFGGIAGEIADILADTNELQTDDVPGTLAAIITDLDDVKGTGFVKDTHSLTDILADVTGLAGAAMRGTDGANTTTPPTAAAIRAEMDSNSTQLAKLGTPAGASVSADIAAVKGETASILADTGTDGVVIATATQTAIADALLTRDMSAVASPASRSPLNALRLLRNRWDVAGTTLTVKEEDDTTNAWTATISTDAAADPITGSNPA